VTPSFDDSAATGSMNCNTRGQECIVKKSDVAQIHERLLRLHAAAIMCVFSAAVKVAGRHK